MTSVKKMLILPLFSALLSAETIKINMSDFANISTRKDDSIRDKVIEVIPVNSTHSVIRKAKVKATEESSTNTTQPHGREAVRDELIKSLRQVITSGEEFKYLFPNYDYGEMKKDIEAMMRDAVSQ